MPEDEIGHNISFDRCKDNNNSCQHNMRSAANRDKLKTLALFLSPAVILYSVFFLFPMIQAFYVAMFRWSGMSPNREFIGLANFKKLLGFESAAGKLVATDPIFWKALTHNFQFMVISLLVVIPLALFFGSVLSRKVWGSGTYRAVYLFPNMISVVAVAVLWSFVYHPQFGVLNLLVSSVGIQPPHNGWLGEPNTALTCMIVTSIWYGLGFYIVLLLAGIQSIPNTYYEAASIDGAGSWQQFISITIPLVWDILKLAIVYLVINTINIFGLVYVMTDAHPTESTHTLLTYLYQKAFSESDFGYATAIGVVVFVLIFAISMASLRLMKREAVEL